MTDVKPVPKKSVALSGVVAGNTALCSVGRSGNDLHYGATASSVVECASGSGRLRNLRWHASWRPAPESPT